MLEKKLLNQICFVVEKNKTDFFVEVQRTIYSEKVMNNKTSLIGETFEL